MSPATLTAGVPWDFETFPEYLDSVERRGTVINYSAYIGHTALRLWVMGDAGYEREATDDELARMADVVREAIAAGAAGFASSSSTTHSGDGGRPVPSRIADVHELEVIMAPLGELGRGVIELLPGEKIKHADVYALQRTIGRPITWTALLTIKGFPWHLDMAALNDKERADGVDVWPQISVRPLVVLDEHGRAVHVQHEPDASRRSWASRSRRRSRRSATPRGAPSRRRSSSPVASSACAGTVSTVSESERFPDLVGRSVADLAAERGVEPLELVLELSCEEDLEHAVPQRPRQRRRRGDRVAPPAGGHAHRALRCRRAREPALRRLYGDGPPRQLGARTGGDPARAPRCASSPASPPTSTTSPVPAGGATCARAWRPTSWCSTPTRSGQGRSAASATSRPTASDSSPTAPRA